MRRSLLVAALAAAVLWAPVLPAADPPPPRSHQEEEQPLAGVEGPVEVSASATCTRFTSGQLSGPSLTITVKVRNPTDRELELGESVVVIERAKQGDDETSSYLARARTGEVPHLWRLQDRYGWAWGYEVDTAGSYSYALVGGGMFAFSSGSVAPYQHLGFGRVSPHAERTLSVEVLLPFEIAAAKRGARTLVLPSVRPLGEGAGPATRTVVQLEPGDVKNAPLRVLAATSFTLSAPDLAAVVRDPARELWLRTAALNWLAEANPAEAGELLVQTAGDEAAPLRLRRAALLDLGLARTAAAAAPLMQLAGSTRSDEVRRLALEALGRIGDSSTAAAVRGYFNHADLGTAAAAMAAAGELRDPEAVEPMLGLVASLAAAAPPAKGKKKGEDLGAVLAALSGRSDLVTAAGGDGRLTAAGKALASIATAPALEALMAELGSAKGLKDFQASALEALAGKEEATALRAAATALSSPHAEVRGRAAQLLGKTKGPAATAPLWQAYRGEQDEQVAAKLATALVDAGLDDRTAPAFLMARLDAKKNPLWFEDVRLLRQVTGQAFGPEFKFSEKKEREAELAKWRGWWLGARASWDTP